MINREIIYERNLTGSYMKIPVGYDAEFDEKMMLKRKLPGLLPVEKCYVNGGGQYWYNISGKQSMDTYCHMKPIGIEFVERTIISICSEIEILEWNLLDVNSLLLDPELIFVTNSNQELIFTVYPGAKDTIMVEFQQLMEYLLTKLDHRDVEAVHMAYSIYEKTLDDGYSIMDIRDSIMESRGQNTIGEKEAETEKIIKEPVKKASVKKEPAMKPPVKKEFAGKEKIKKESVKKVIQKNFQGQSDLFQSMLTIWTEWKEKLLHWRKKPMESKTRDDIEVVYPDEIEEEIEVREQLHPTICLSDYREHPEGLLLYEGMENFANIRLEKEISRIGQGVDADIVIAKDTISHFHAKIACEGQEYYLEDLNSTNGTFINEETLSYKERRQLKSNDIIRFADVKYRFI